MSPAAAGAVVREIVTPEGVALRLEVARGGDRVAAFVLDLLLMGLACLAVFLFAGLVMRDVAERWVDTFLILVTFLIRTFYFMWFELRWRGATPGKRRLGIRVTDRRGGPLRADAIIVRNLMRELEFWLPLAVLLAGGAVWPDAPAWAQAASWLWLLVFTTLPLFNRNRLRIGDLVAGTLVVVAPRAALLSDLGGQEVRRQQRAAAEFTFTQEQLDVYGIYELQVLEDLLRRRDEHKRGAVQAVCKRIQRKIKWQGPPARNERFLHEFYAALRAHLEKKMLLGKRKRDKHSS